MTPLNKSLSSIVQQAASNERERSTSNLTEIEKEKVRRVFQGLRALYGSARYESTYPDEAAEKAAMRMWAKEILGLSWQQLNERMNYAKKLQGSEDKKHQFPDIGRFLQGGKNGGHASLSYRPVDEVLGLPKLPTEEEKKIGHEALKKLRSTLGE